MALTNTIGTFYQPFKDKSNAYTPIQVELAISAGSTATVYAVATYYKIS